jgi:hypothetical protein
MMKIEQDQSKWRSQFKAFPDSLIFVDVVLIVNELSFHLTTEEMVQCDKCAPTIRRLFEYFLELLTGAQ